MTIDLLVVGLGRLGTFHTQKFKELDDVNVIGGIDPDADARARWEDQFSKPTSSTWTELVATMSDTRAAVVAAPTERHRELACSLLEQGCHVLVEKPLAKDVAEADDVVSLATNNDLVLQVGHTERHNPAVRAALPLISRPGFFSSERLAPFSGRSTDIDVVHDLMIHDIDVLLATVSSPVRSLDAVGMPVLTEHTDMASCRIRFANGLVAQLSAGRASLEPVRKIRFFTPERYVSIDCAGQTVKSVHRNRQPDGRMNMEIEPVDVQPDDALRAQAQDFIDAIRKRRAPVVDGRQGRRALEIADQVAQRIASNAEEHPTLWRAP